MRTHGRSKRYLIVPMQPTPNGRLHLGHASGPYLRADVLGRHLKRLGHGVTMISGSDVYENWILLDGIRHDRAPAETCSRFHRLIAEDLRALDIGIDDYLTPLDPEHAEAYAAVHERILDRLIGRGRARLVPERVPVSSGSGRYVVGVWLLGRCPNCRADTYGNACEACGYHYQPSEILDPRSRLDEGPLEWREERCWYLSPSPADLETLRRLILASGASADLVAVALRYIDQTGGRVRLTIPGDWGVTSARIDPGTVICNTFYAYCVYCGEVHRRREGARLNPFERASDVTTVALFGIDNAIAGLVGAFGIALCHGELKAFDHVGTNHFLTLEGRKFSTSRGHAIWVGELIGGTSVTADEVRFQLAAICPETGEANLDVEAFVEAVNRFRRIIAGDIAAALAAAAGRAPAPDGTLGEIEALLAAQAESLDPGGLSVAKAFTAFDAWLARAPELARRPRGAYWWLKGVALLGEPFVPGLAGSLWSALGGEGRPTVGGLAEPTRPRLPAPAIGTPREPLRREELAPYVHLA